MGSIVRTSLDNLELITGEKMTKINEDVILDGAIAIMHCTNFRIIFLIQNGILISIPIHSIMYTIYKTDKNIRSSSSITLQLRSLHSLIISSKSPHKLHKTIGKIIKICKNSPRCTLSYLDTEEILKKSQFPTFLCAQKPINYFLKFCDSILYPHWRISDINKNYHLSPCYPKVLCFPDTISDRMISTLGSTMNDGRVPVITWIDTITNVAIYRGGILLGDQITEEYWKAIQLASKPNSVLPILVEEASTTSTLSSIALYMSSETEISSLLEAISQKEIIKPFKIDSFREILRWERRIRSVINSVKAVSNMIVHETKSVVLQSNNRGGPLYSVSALTQLLIDSKYRTLRGFCSLIEKEFVYFGFPFTTKIDNTKKSLQSPISEHSGGFILFLDSIWTILTQFSFAFEFNKELLVFLLDAVISGIYDTFGSSCEKDRKSENHRSIWTFILRDPHPFLNFNFSPCPSVKLLSLCETKLKISWNSWILQYKLAFTPTIKVSSNYFIHQKKKTTK